MIRSVRRQRTFVALLVAAVLVVCATHVAASQGGRDAGDKDEKENAEKAKGKKAKDTPIAKGDRSKEQKPPSEPPPGANSKRVDSNSAAPDASSPIAGTTTQPPPRGQAKDGEEPGSEGAGDASWLGASMLMLGGGAVALLVLCGAGFVLWRFWQPGQKLASALPYPDRQFANAGRIVDEPHPIDAAASGRTPNALPNGDAQLAEVLSELRALSQKVDSLHGELRSSIKEISRDPATRRAAVEETRPQGFYYGASQDAAPSAPAAIPTPVTTPATLHFPAPVSECHRVIKQIGLAASHASKGVAPGSLQQSSEGGTNTAFVIVACGAEAASDFYALPSRPRLSQEQDYYSFFKNYYECASVAAGELTVEAPAVVRRTGNEWMLSKKGTLTVR